MNTAVVGTAGTTEERALELLGIGTAPAVVASALGVSESRISQLLSEETFALEVAERRFQNLREHTARDGKYDALEDKILTKLESSLELVFQPAMLAKILQIINNAKRRGSNTPESVTSHTNIVTLNMPVSIKRTFIQNINGQVTQVGSQDLTTIPSGNLLKKLEKQVTHHDSNARTYSGDERKVAASG